jgi:hypothetical protein
VRHFIEAVKVVTQVESTQKKGRCNSKLMEASAGVTYIAYEFNPKKLFIVCQSFGMSQEVLLLNPQLKNGVEIGILLRVPSLP